MTAAPVADLHTQTYVADDPSPAATAADGSGNITTLWLEDTASARSAHHGPIAGTIHVDVHTPGDATARPDTASVTFIAQGDVAGHTQQLTLTGSLNDLQVITEMLAAQAVRAATALQELGELRQNESVNQTGTGEEVAA